jgi:hypothetical protein
VKGEGEEGKPRALHSVTQRHARAKRSSSSTPPFDGIPPGTVRALLTPPTGNPFLATPVALGRVLIREEGEDGGHRIKTRPCPMLNARNAIVARKRTQPLRCEPVTVM